MLSVRKYERKGEREPAAGRPIHPPKAQGPPNPPNPSRQRARSPSLDPSSSFPSAATHTRIAHERSARARSPQARHRARTSSPASSSTRRHRLVSSVARGGAPRPVPFGPDSGERRLVDSPLCDASPLLLRPRLVPRHRRSCSVRPALEPSFPGRCRALSPPPHLPMRLHQRPPPPSVPASKPREIRRDRDEGKISDR